MEAISRVDRRLEKIDGLTLNLLLGGYLNWLIFGQLYLTDDLFTQKLRFEFGFWYVVLLMQKTSWLLNGIFKAFLCSLNGFYSS